jgi:hypothetical protein
MSSSSSCAQSWSLSNRAAPEPRAIADRHYNRQKIGARQFVPPGRCVVLYQPNAFWVTSWPFPEYVKHAWAGAWICSAFRNEGAGLSSDLIRQAIAATRAIFGTPPPMGMVTFVDAGKVRHKRDPGRCFIKAGFKPCGHTKGGLVALQLTWADIPEPIPPLGMTMEMAV